MVVAATRMSGVVEQGPMMSRAVSCCGRTVRIAHGMSFRDCSEVVTLTIQRWFSPNDVSLFIVIFYDLTVQ